jgi:hypothetical protein
MPIDPVQGGYGVRLSMMNSTIDASLVDRVRRGEYQIDARAVAEAMIRRWDGASFVLVAPQALDQPAVGSDEGEPGSGPDVT